MFETFKLNIENHIAHLSFNRPHKANSLNQQAWHEMKAAFEHLDENEEVRVVILSGEGKHFCAGIDLEMLMSVQNIKSISCQGRRAEQIRKFIFELQDCITAIEKCRKPVLAAIHKACVGGGVDITSTCDMRYCTEDAYFSIKEIDLGMVADIGTLQRLPKILNPGMINEMAYTGRKVFGPEAEKVGLVNKCFQDKNEMMEAVENIARMIASKSPLSIRGTKEIIQYTRDHSVADSLHYMSTWNAAMLLSEDLNEAFMANLEKREASFNG